MDQLSSYDYTLPEELIAYYPTPERTASRMLVLERDSGHMEIKKFSEICTYLNRGDCLVLNNTQVIKGRIYGKKEITNASVEVMLISPVSTDSKQWSCLLKPGKRVKPGTRVYISPTRNSSYVSDIYFTVKTTQNDGSYIIEFNYDNIYELMEKFGHIPLPPYIKREDEFSDLERYQTVYSKIKGAVAAPTAGLHFTKEILEALALSAVNIAELTLHVGAGTFRPVSSDNIIEHKMHSEEYFINSETAELINKTKAANKKVFAVGTTTVRVLESVASSDGFIESRKGWTDIFIKPKYKFKTVDAMLTNFHLPKSTLLMLVSAFADLNLIKEAYRYAISERMRFYSYGDCMLII
ncbi:MAG TPA: tRNA preQ1(34) S-adenosylmethionine ribosyltransferase-isomerase QueA [Lentisphaeria bacterium]|nr:MAG: tRNA preQ1(34) S-adenosylmethionine ribosyltransferase-isomerase QueA [Lentisphaerae bacterium GWF2_38_69]HBM16183.1 tRNA preQ1(34) S-adenosylmethionine ribosyltransferase-isomerase QueA [Lentisphaeria bacterium]